MGSVTMTNIHIVNHTHWDREWYFTSMDCIVLSDQLFTDVLEELKRQPNATFVLDGQLSILDDYLELYPEKLAEIKELVAKGQLFIVLLVHTNGCVFCLRGIYFKKCNGGRL